MIKLPSALTAHYTLDFRKLENKFRRRPGLKTSSVGMKNTIGGELRVRSSENYSRKSTIGHVFAVGMFRAKVT